jgi:sugar phosphate isomerase/epimerase
MRFGLIHYNAPGNTLEEFLDYAREAGFGWVELSVGDVWPKEEDPPERTVEAARRLLEARGLKASALAARNDFVVLEEEAVAAQVTRMKRVCEVARLLGTGVIRTEGGAPKEGVPESKWAEAIAGCLSRCRDFVEPMGLKLAMDNHGLVTNDGDLEMEVLGRVNSPNIGLNLDTMNYRWFGHDLETLDRYFEITAKHVFHTHLKDGRGCRQQYVGTALGEGEINLEHTVACLKRAGYHGVWCAEYEGRQDPAEGYRKCLAWMRAHVPAD